MIKEFIKKNGFAGMFYIGAKTLDTLLTAYNSKNYGTYIEENPILRNLMDNLGIYYGVGIHSTIELELRFP